MSLNYKVVIGDEPKRPDIVEKTIDKVFHERYVVVRNLLIDACTRFIKPQIKGEVTAGKLKWRGVVFCSQKLEWNIEKMWIEQRGKIASEIIEFDFTNYILIRPEDETIYVQSDHWKNV